MRFRPHTYARTQQSLPPLWATVNVLKVRESVKIVRCNTDHSISSLAVLLIAGVIKQILNRKICQWSYMKHDTKESSKWLGTNAFYKSSYKKIGFKMASQTAKLSDLQISGLWLLSNSFTTYQSTLEAYQKYLPIFYIFLCLSFLNALFYRFLEK